jgi:glucose-6-phosphate isomerase
MMHALLDHQRRLSDHDFARCMETDSSRADRFQVRLGSLVYYYAMNRITDQTLALLVALAHERKVAQQLKALFAGERLNTTENQSALHMAYRGHSLIPTSAVETVHAEKARLFALAERLHSKAYTDCLHIGIGGSDLGPKLLNQCFQGVHKPHIKMHFISTPDYQHLHQVLSDLNPATTLIIVASKSFTTAETIDNATWIKNNFHVPRDNWVAITAQPDAATSFGIPKENVLTIPSWVGGRYGIWSSMSLSAVLAFGTEAYQSFLDGGRLVDEHVLSAPLEANIPVLMALLGVWYRNAWGCQTHAILPYAKGLDPFVPFCQQLEMESLGKSSTLDGKPLLKTDTAPALWGGQGPDFQHAFGQALHQGSFWCPIDFIVPVDSAAPEGQVLQDRMVANAISQASILLTGASANEPSRQLTGNRPSNTLFIKQCDPFHCGALIALYEHKVFVQSVIWGINPFDQFGVEWGKQLARQLSSLKAPQKDLTLDATCQGLLSAARGV